MAFITDKCTFHELTDDVIAFYKKNGFHSLFSTEEQEFLYTGGKKGQPVTLTTRLMYYDLLEMRNR